MNRTRREKLRTLMARISDIRDELEAVCEEEDEARESMPENMQDGDRYAASEECSEAMTSGCSSLDEAIGYIEDAVQG